VAKPKNVILIVADSLRFDSAYQQGGPQVPYLEQNAIQFTNARSAGCWTLPATCSMFTGMLPHQHGATSQSRWLKNEIPSLPEILKPAGYKPVQVSANIVTTDIFNVSKGFDEVYRTWDFTESKHQWMLRLVLAANRPRIRRMVLKPNDQVFEKISEDLRQGIIWAQRTSTDSFNKARKLIAENNAKGQGVFMFINLMESHYPYHIADKFTLMNKSLTGKIHEWKILYNVLSQTFLTKDKQVLTPEDLKLMHEKQKLAWKLVKDEVDAFCKEMHDGQDNLVVFCSDHGENFGDQGWQYHFSNVTDGGNRVPLFWLDHEHGRAETKPYNISARYMFNDLLRACGVDTGNETLMKEADDNLPLIESFWYDNDGRTLDKYKYNQVAFIQHDKRFVLRAGEWMYAPVGKQGDEPVFEYVEKSFNPLEELNLEAGRKKYLEQSIKEFSGFSEKIMNKGK